MTTPASRSFPLLALALAAGCSGAGGTGSTVTSDTSAIQSLLASSNSDQSTAKACFDAFKSCLDAASDDAARAACKATLEACLPARPDAPLGPGDACEGAPPDGGDHGERGPRGERGGPPPADGAAPKGPPPDGGLDGKGKGAPMHCGLGGPGADACKTALDACLADSNNVAADCLATAKQCVKDVIAANFKAACEARLAHCQACAVDPAACDPIAALCAAGAPTRD